MNPLPVRFLTRRNTDLLTRPVRRAVLGLHPLEDRITPNTYTVTNTNDSGSGSLRQALLAADGNSGADTIVFSPLFNTPQTIALTGGEILINDSVTIQGPGAGLLTVTRAATAPAFRIFESAAPSLTISGVTVSGGSDFGGGGLKAGGTVVLDSVVFANNKTSGTAFGDGGGAVYMEPFGTLTVRNSTISGNTAEVSGGGLYFYLGGSLLVQNSTISGNTTTAPTNGRGGAGIYLYYASAVLQNTTITGNTSGSSGGGVMLRFSYSRSLTVQNCTITGNSAANANSGEGGGGIERSTGDAVINITSSVVSGNTNTNGPDILSKGTVNVNFSAVGSNTGFTLTGANNLPFGANLMLGPLADNGGPTQTIAPLPGSPLIDAGTNAAGLATDQRGPTFVRQYGSSVDIGAVEVQPPSVLGITTPTASPTNATALTFTVTFNQSLSGLSAANFALTTTGTAAGTIGTPTGSGTTWTVPVTGVAGDGTLRLDLVNDTGVTNAAGISPGIAFLPYTAGQVVTLDHTPPTVQSITKLDPDPVLGATARFQLTFSEPVTGLTAANLALDTTGVTGAALQDVSGSGTTWTVTVNVGAGDGTVGLRMADSTGVADAAGNPVAGLPAVGPSYDVLVVVLSITGPASTVNGGSTAFTVVFNQPVTGLSASNFHLDLTGTAVGTVGTPTGSGTTWTVPVTGILGTGTMRLVMDNSAGVDPVVNQLPFASDPADIDRIYPMVTAIQPVGSSQTNAATADFAVTFSEAVSGLTAANFAVTVLTGNVTAAGVIGVSGSGTSWTVTVGLGDGEGVIRLDMVNTTGVNPPVDPLPYTGGATLTIDRTAPVGLTTTPVGPNPTNAGSVQFAVTFDEPVVGLAPANFAVVTTGGITGAAVTNLTGSGASYTVTVITGLGDGTIRLVLATPNGVTDPAGNPLVNQPFDATALEVDKTFPTIQSITRLGPSPTNAAGVQFAVAFSEVVTGVTPGAFFVLAVGGVSGASVTGVSTSDGRVYTVTVGTGTGDGTVRLDLINPAGIADRVGQALTARMTGPTYTIDKTPPKVAVTQGAGPSAVTGLQPVQFAVVFSEPVSGFGADDVVLGGTAGPGNVTVTGSGTTYTILVDGLTHTGTVTAAVRAAAATDAAGNPNLASAGANNALTFVLTAPAVPDSYATRALTPLAVAAPGVLTNDADPEGRPLTAVLVAGPAANEGTVVLNPDGSFVFRPAPGFLGTATFTYQTFNGLAAGAPTTVSVAVTPRVTLSAVAAGAGGGPQVTVYNQDGTVRFNFFVYAPTFTGGVYVATGDLTGDGVDDIVTGAGVGGGPHVRVYDGATGAEVLNFFAYDPSVRGGVSVAVGDVDGDGFPDLITGAGPGGGPHVKVFSAAGVEKFGFFAYAPTFTGGVTVAAGDINGDHVDDIAVGAGPGGGPHVQVFDGRTRQVLLSFFAFDPSVRGGVSVAIGDAYADGTADVFAGSGTNGVVRVFRGGLNGVRLTAVDITDPVPAQSVRVATSDTNGDGVGDRLLVATGPGTPPLVRRYDLATFAVIDDLVSFPQNFLGGLYVG